MNKEKVERKKEKVKAMENETYGTNRTDRSDGLAEEKVEREKVKVRGQLTLLPGYQFPAGLRAFIPFPFNFYLFP